MAQARALELKAEGNSSFTKGDYIGAEAMYSKAINILGTDPVFYTNRAMARLKLGMHEGVIADCDQSLVLQDSNMKAHFNKAQAELALDRPSEALSSAQKAYELCVHGDRRWQKDMSAVGQLVLRCKKRVWEVREKARMTTDREKLRAMVDDFYRVQEPDDEVSMSRAPQADQGHEGIGQQIKKDILTILTKKLEDEEAARTKRTVPDWIIDDISFCVMHDPVITKTGKSYERASIMEHLRRSETDPLTREPLMISDLRPNLSLRTACDDFLVENGWAVDY